MSAFLRDLKRPRKPSDTRTMRDTRSLQFSRYRALFKLEIDMTPAISSEIANSMAYRNNHAAVVHSAAAAAYRDSVRVTEPGDRAPSQAPLAHGSARRKFRGAREELHASLRRAANGSDDLLRAFLRL